MISVVKDAVITVKDENKERIDIYLGIIKSVFPKVKAAKLTSNSLQFIIEDMSQVDSRKAYLYIMDCELQNILVTNILKEFNEEPAEEPEEHNCDECELRSICQLTNSENPLYKMMDKMFKQSSNPIPDIEDKAALLEAIRAVRKFVNNVQPANDEPEKKEIKTSSSNRIYTGNNCAAFFGETNTLVIVALDAYKRIADYALKTYTNQVTVVEDAGQIQIRFNTAKEVFDAVYNMSQTGVI